VNGTKAKPSLLHVPRLKVSADGAGVVSHAGVGLLREIADLSGLSSQVSEVLADTFKGPWVHDPGRVFTDLAAAVADGADCVSGIGQLLDQQAQHGPVASVTTTWRMIDQRIDTQHLAGVKKARSEAREKVWATGGAPQVGTTLVIDVDATITIDQSEGKENSASTWKRTYGYHPLLAFLDRPDISGGEALAALLRPGNAGSNTAADHIIVLTEALASVPAQYRPTPDGPEGPDVLDGTNAPKVLVRSDSAGATHTFAKACREQGVGFSFGFAVTAPVKEAIVVLGEAAVPAHFDGINVWADAVNSDGSTRDGAWIAEATAVVDLSAWPVGTRLILAERTAAPRGAVAVHRPGRASDHRVYHRHSRRGGARSVGRIGSAAPATRPGGGQDPPGQGHRAAKFPVLPRSSERRLVGDHHDRNRSHRLDETARLRRPPRVGAVRDRHLPLPGTARRRPDHPRSPPDQTPPGPAWRWTHAIAHAWSRIRAAFT